MAPVCVGNKLVAFLNPTKSTPAKTNTTFWVLGKEGLKNKAPVPCAKYVRVPIWNPPDAVNSTVKKKT